ncbi:unnamed protein product, partial [Mesorhabditis belari]|uniref:GDP-Man:Man(3)GlcNAc(2)-PP-Dol alpha-1,2-mannosyltransferase n=1 Tax=Mesorhabditis belari TaxID=2138241 RepID=A0AAF3EA81_9BILA
MLAVYFRRRRVSGTIAFFHPYCNAGGGGERVLWCAIKAMQQRNASSKQNAALKFRIYSGDVDATKEQILLKARQRFNIEIDPKDVDFVFLRLRRLVEADLYPVFTLLFQIFAGGILAFEALCRLNPEVMIDSMGYPLSLPVFRFFGGAKVAAYVHYPVISSDMIKVVAERRAAFNNADLVAKNPLLASVKLRYYQLLAYLYGLIGSTADVVMANGTWTADHISQIWKRKDIEIVFPPCDVESLLSIESTAEERLENDSEVQVLSIGQIRPEKNHALQIEIIKLLDDRLKETGFAIKAKLRIVGGCRHAEDLQRVEQLKAYAQKIGATKLVNWSLNVPYDVLLENLSSSLISIHTMWNEHFGISVVEGVAAGTIMVAHNSGGPLMDIVVPATGNNRVGYLAATAQEYADQILEIIKLSKEERSAIRERARTKSKDFNEELFAQKWLQLVLLKFGGPHQLKVLNFEISSFAMSPVYDSGVQ